MSHAHTLIRAAAVTALTGMATTAARVYGNRMYPLADANLPGLRVYLNDENVDTDTIHAPAILSRTVQLVVECCAKANTALDTACDTMQEEVETALAAGFTAGAKSLTPQLIGSRYDFEEAGTPVGVKRLVFSIEFYTLANAPGTLI
jgi:hypothetical protein